MLIGVHLILYLQMSNHLPFGMEVYYSLGDGASGKCGEMAPDAILNVPIGAVYAAPYELFFKPLNPE